MNHNTFATENNIANAQFLTFACKSQRTTHQPCTSHPASPSPNRNAPPTPYIAHTHQHKSDTTPPSPPSQPHPYHPQACAQLSTLPTAVPRYDHHDIADRRHPSPCSTAHVLRSRCHARTPPRKHTVPCRQSLSQVQIPLHCLTSLTTQFLCWKRGRARDCSSTPAVLASSRNDR